ncbi:hypothetical protein BDV59DRAFT_173273 [Aspergillus ambiguus]|uniref:25S rRNA (uracil2843-N3)-methyltransferase n=1 Tax=Aspergillus ambiguus TaxID=176160 RepID=UPI003CCDE88A
MGAPRNNPRRTTKDHNARDAKRDKKKSAQTSSRRQPSSSNTPEEPDSEIDLSATIPLTLQQLLLNVFKTGLLSTDGDGWRQEHSPDSHVATHPPLDIKSLIQTIKSHLYNRDFDSAFTDASDDLLCAYALRWSAARALGYAGVFKAVMQAVPSADSSPQHIACIGGGAGAEIVALAAVWRDAMDEARLSARLADVSLQEETGADAAADATPTSAATAGPSTVTVTAVDIADWSRVVDRLAFAIRSADVQASKTHPAPLYRRTSQELGGGAGGGDDEGDFSVRFRRADVLSVSDEELKSVLRVEGAATAMVTLMFTLNELFSTSMAKATGFLLRMTDLLEAGTLLLVVDSPGSYSTLKLGKGKVQGEGETTESAVQERKYPMKFLLDHSLLSVASGKWEKVLSQDSRWWRREAARLRYDVGEGAGLEDMRFQVHIYRRIDG